MSEAPDQWLRLLDGIREGDPKTVRDFWDNYGPLLYRLADKHLEGGIRRRVEPDDVVQSVCRTFLRRAQDGQFTLGDSTQLWSLLCAITLNKVRRLLRFHLRRKRSMDQEARGAASSEDASAMEFSVPSDEPTPSEAAEFDDELQKLLASLDDEQRQVVDLKLQNFTHEEIAEKLGCSERTVRRLVKIVQSHLERQLESAIDAR